MKVENKSWLPASLAALLLSMAMVATAASSGWVVVSSPNPDVQNVLDAAGGVSQSDVWAVGYEADANYDLFTLAEHWDGTSLAAFPTPSPGSTECAPFVAERSLQSRNCAGWPLQQRRSAGCY